MLVDRPREQLFADAALALEEDREIGLRRAEERREEMAHRERARIRRAERLVARDDERRRPRIERQVEDIGDRG